MTKRARMLALLVLSGGVVLQVGGCAQSIALLVAQQVVSGVFTTILANALGA
jgi:hypothetical protein